VTVLVVVVAPDEWAASLEAVGLAVSTFGPAALLEAGDPAEPGDSSAHARPPLHPVMMAAPTPKATAKPPTRRMYATLGMPNVYRPMSIAVPEMQELPNLPTFAGRNDYRWIRWPSARGRTLNAPADFASDMFDTGEVSVCR
jgi:hypothetical protein